MKSIINRVSKFCLNWVSFAVVMFASTALLDSHTPGIGYAGATPLSITCNLVMSLCIAILWMCAMVAIRNKTEPKLDL